MKRLLCYVLLLLLKEAMADSVIADVQITAGEDAGLPCSVPVGTVIVLEWEKSEEILLFYRDGKMNDRYQDEPFRNRVQLQDPKMTSGNLGVILQRVTVKDSGIFTCEALVETAQGQRTVVTETIQLVVSEENTPVNSALQLSNDKEEVPTNEMEEETLPFTSRSHSDNSSLNIPLVSGLSGVFAICIIGIITVFIVRWIKRQPIRRSSEKSYVSGNLA